MYFYLYRILCTQTKRYYFGVHSTKKLNDGYFGSGYLLKKSVQKYGKENHRFEILEYFSSYEEMFNREAEIVTLELLKDEFCLNLKPGGSGGWSCNFDSEIQKSKNARGLKKLEYLRNNNPEWVAKTSKNLSEAFKLDYKEGRRVSAGWSKKAQEAALSVEANNKRKATMAANKHNQGEKNSQYGSCWVSNNVHTIKIKVELLEEYLSKGYIKGRKLIK